MPATSLFNTVDLLTKAKKVKDHTAQDYKYSLRMLSLLAIDLDNPNPTFTYLTSKLDGQHSYVNKALAVIKTTAKINGRTLNGEPYFLLVNLLKAKHKSIIGYSDEQTKMMVKATMPSVEFDFSLHKLVITLAMTGARVSSLAGIRIGEFKLVPNFKDLFYRVVMGKGKGNGYPYPIFLPRKTLDYLASCCKEGDDSLTSWSPEKKSTFRNYCSAKLIFKLKQYRQMTDDPKEQALLDSLSIGTSIFHSLRKNFSVRLANEEILKKDGDTISLLLGQKPNTLAYKVYVLSDGQKFDNVLIRMATAYAGTSLMNLELWK